ncbi:4-phosphoerythronate dehydrogenase [Agaribacterium sp. ZY112]|uniref:4-phosphoerythronate dehydrogenase n=1 Tax=Agaribacterium sp. ZY112 TaxID=3233574 RepID=UPI0035259D51
MLNILADENIPFAKELFSELGEVSLLAGRTMKHADLESVDALLVRSVTQVNKELLSGHKVQFVGTCTIGTDHLDKQYFEQQGISYSAAPGCNALGVVQYVITVLAALGRLEQSNKVAIVGCGNVGGRVWQYLKALGMDCYCIDPHLNKTQLEDLSDFESIYDCDIVCMHTPKIADGPYPTVNLIGAEELNKLKKGALLINAGRGECIDNHALLAYMQTHNDLDVVLDVWANEPHMLPELFAHVKYGSPHIAGYSFEGKVNGTTMIFEKLALQQGKDQQWINERINALRSRCLGQAQELEAASLQALVLKTYDIDADHERLNKALPELPSSFDLLRKTYPKRREFSHYKFKTSDLNLAAKAKALGFECA